MGFGIPLLVFFEEAVPHPLAHGSPHGACLKIARFARAQAGCIPSLHICGETGPILKKMVETGVSIVELDYDVDLKVAKEEIGKDVCIEGNINPVSILLQGRSGDVEKKAGECISKAEHDGGFILSSGCKVPLDTPAENIRATVLASRRGRR